MPLGTMILPSLITPKSSFPSLSLSLALSFFLPLSLISQVQYANTHFYTHMLTHAPYAKACAPSHPEWAAALVIRDALWLGGRENLAQFLSVRIHPLFLSVYSPGAWMISISQSLSIRSRAVIRGVLEQTSLEWRKRRNAIFLNDRLFLFLFFLEREREKQRQMVTRRTGRDGGKRNKESVIFMRACERAGAMSSECSSFPLCQRLIVYDGSGLSYLCFYPLWQNCW